MLGHPTTHTGVFFFSFSVQDSSTDFCVRIPGGTYQKESNNCTKLFGVRRSIGNQTSPNLVQFVFVCRGAELNLLQLCLAHRLLTYRPQALILQIDRPSDVLLVRKKNITRIQNFTSNVNTWTVWWFSLSTITIIFLWHLNGKLSGSIHGCLFLYLILLVKWMTCGNHQTHTSSLRTSRSECTAQTVPLNVAISLSRSSTCVPKSQASFDV